MSKLTTLLVAVAALFMLSLASPADAAQRKADGIQKPQADQHEVSDQRRYRRYHRRYYRPYYGYGYGYPYGYYRPYYGYGYPYGYAAPGIGFNFRF